jgi:hypothetical protein
LDLAVMVNKILLQLLIGNLVLDVSMRFEKYMYHVCIMLLLKWISIGEVLEVLIWHIALIFNDHVIQDDVTGHYFSYHFGFVVLRATKKGKALMKYTESSL